MSTCLLTTDQLKLIISKQLRVPLEEVTSNADFLVDLGGDSLALAELIAMVERQIGRQIPAQRLFEITTVGELIAVLEDLDVAQNDSITPIESSSGGMPPAIR